MGVTAVLGDDRLRAVLADQRGDDGVDGAQPRRARRARRHGDVHGGALGRAGHADVGRGARAGEQGAAVLVDRDGQHARVVPEDGLDAVAVVRVEVQVGDALRAEVQQALDRRGGVVVDAEAGRRARHRVVHAARDVDAVRDLAAPQGVGELDGPAELPRGGLVHAREQRVVVGAQAAHQVGLQRGPGMPDGGHVVGVVHGLDDRVRGGLGAHHLERGPVEQAERLDEPHRQVEAGGRHGVPGAEVVLEESRTPDQPGEVHPPTVTDRAGEGRCGSRPASRTSRATPRRARPTALAAGADSSRQCRRSAPLSSSS